MASLGISPNSPMQDIFEKVVELFRRPSTVSDASSQKILPPLPEASANPLLTAAMRPLPASVDLLQNLLNIFSPLQNRGIDKLLPQLAARLLDKVPSTNHKMLSDMMNFVRAARQNAPQVWLGKELSAELRAHGADGEAVVAKASEFLQQSQRDGIGWRLIEMPFLSDAGLSKMRLAFKKTQDNEDDETSQTQQKNGARFIVETDFSRLGQFQFDGFAQAKDRRFDLILRTGRRLPADFVSQIVRLFKTSLHDLNYVGNITVNVNDNFVKIDDAAAPSQIKDGVYI